MSEGKHDEWIVTHPHELVATFLIPLPDPLPLADGAVLPSYRQVGHDQVELLQAWLNDLWLMRVEDFGVVPYSDVRAREAAESSAENWSNKFALVTSIQFHQSFSDAGLRLGLEPALRLAATISGPRLTPDEKRETLDALDLSTNTVMNSELREAGLGAVTVAECYVNLRILGELPALESPLTNGAPEEPPFGPAESEQVHPHDIAMWSWRAFLPPLRPDPRLVERRIRNALTIALEELRSIERAVLAMRRAPTALITRERLPVLLPVVLRRVSEIGDPEVPAQLILLQTQPTATQLLLPAPLSDDEISSFNSVRQHMDGGPFSVYLDVFREANVALNRLGDQRLAALLGGIAAESLLDELILHLIWEEGVTPERAASDWIDGLDTRVRTQLPSRIGGSWDFSRSDPVGAWAQHVAELRHRVVHAAYVPTEAQARRSLTAVNELVTELCSRLASTRVRNKYPRTALALAGRQGLERRSAYTRRLRDLQRTSDVEWLEAFTRWREAWRRTRQDRVIPRNPDVAGAGLLAVRHADRQIRWVRQDRAQHLAIEVDMVDEPATDQLATIHASADRMGHADGYSSPISVGWAGPLRTRFRPGSLWVEDYHHLPMAEVMVDGSDYTCPADIGIPV